MELSSSLLLKVFGGLAVASTATTIGVLKRDSIASALGFTISITEADQKLIDYINTNKQDIVFKVLKEEDGTNDLDDSYLNFSTTTKVIVVRVTVDTVTEDQFKVVSGTAKKPTLNELKNLNKINNEGTAWTWECKIKIVADGDISNATELADKEKLLKTATPEGFFDILKKDSTDTANTEKTDEIKKWKETKVKFIKNCASAERNNKPRKIIENKISSLQEFKIKKGNVNIVHEGSQKQVTTKLYFADKNKFDKWFKLS